MVKRCLLPRPGRGARRSLKVAIGLLFATAIHAPASAGWLDDAPLRGGMFDSVPRWDGFNFGATIGNSSMATNFGNAASQQIAFILRNTTLEAEQRPSEWTVLPSATATSMQYNAFIGYNWQFSDLVTGFDVGYTHVQGLQNTVSDSIARQVSTSDGFTNDVFISAQSSMKLIDYATVRARAGYVFGPFLPYAMMGVAVGRFNYATSVTVTTSGTNSSTTPPTTYGPITDSDSVGKNNAVSPGFLTGLGADIMVTPNVFLRGEWEFIAFAPLNSIRSNISAYRAGLGIRF